MFCGVRINYVMLCYVMVAIKTLEYKQHQQYQQQQQQQQQQR